MCLEMIWLYAQNLSIILSLIVNIWFYFDLFGLFETERVFTWSFYGSNIFYFEKS